MWNQGSVTITGTAIDYNRGTLGIGGIVNTGTLTITHSQLAFNFGPGPGGACGPKPAVGLR